MFNFFNPQKSPYSTRSGVPRGTSMMDYGASLLVNKLGGTGSAAATTSSVRGAVSTGGSSGLSTPAGAPGSGGSQSFKDRLGEFSKIPGGGIAGGPARTKAFPKNLSPQDQWLMWIQGLMFEAEAEQERKQEQEGIAATNFRNQRRASVMQPSFSLSY